MDSVAVGCSCAGEGGCGGEDGGGAVDPGDITGLLEMI